jgi:hypothetical protein
MRTWAVCKIRAAICHWDNPNWNPSPSKTRRIWEPWFYIYRGTNLWTVALKRPIFKQKKGFANLSFGLLLCSEALSQPWSRDTVPLTWSLLICLFWMSRPFWILYYSIPIPTTQTTQTTQRMCSTTVRTVALRLGILNYKVWFLSSYTFAWIFKRFVLKLWCFGSK